MEIIKEEAKAYSGFAVSAPGDCLSQVALDWIGDDGELLEFAYSKRRASYLGQRRTAGSRIAALDAATRCVTLDLDIRDEAGQVTTLGRAIVRLRH